MIKAKELLDNKGYWGLSQESILCYYLGIEKIVLGFLYRNPFRKDNNPSAGFYYGSNGVLFFHDFATGTHYSWASVVKAKYGLGYRDVLEKIRMDKDNIQSLSIKEVEKEEVELEIVVSPDRHGYFDRYYISQETLERFSVFNIKSVYRNGKLHSKATKTNPIFAYSFPSGRIKLYRPLSIDKSKKWYGNSSSDDLGGFEQLPKKGNLLVITKSLKDTMVLCEMGIPSISFNAESVGVGDKVDYSDLIKMLKYRFYNVIVLYDNDDAGIVAARKLCAKYNLRSIILQKKKDISDLVFTYGKPKAFKQLKKRLSRVLRINTITPY